MRLKNLPSKNAPSIQRTRIPPYDLSKNKQNRFEGLLDSFIHVYQNGVIFHIEFGLFFQYFYYLNNLNYF